VELRGDGRQARRELYRGALLPDADAPGARAQGPELTERDIESSAVLPGDAEGSLPVDDDVDDRDGHGLSTGSVGGTYGTAGSCNSLPSPVSHADTEVRSTVTINATANPLRPRTPPRLPVAFGACPAVDPPQF
jgi:hypothetical protein